MTSFRRNEDGFTIVELVFVLVLIVVMVVGALVMNDRAIKNTITNSNEASLIKVFKAEKAVHDQQKTYVDATTLKKLQPLIQSSKLNNKVYIVNANKDNFCAFSYQEKFRSRSNTEVGNKLGLKDKQVYWIDKAGKPKLATKSNPGCTENVENLGKDYVTTNGFS